MSDNFKRGRSFTGKGYYIALILCAAAIGITGYLYYRSESTTQQVSLEEPPSEEMFLDLENAQDVPALATQPPATTPATVPTTPQATAREPLKTMSPVAGDPVFGYSMETLSYNQTTRDWRVHDGIDLAAEAGAPVCAAADGQVFTVQEDDAFGNTVVIRHRDGYTTRYASLADNIPVKPGDTVTIGQTIGFASDTAIVESTMGSHVHFSVTCYDETVDPMEFLSLGQ